MDNRRNNGNKGHSTKAKGIDKRKNEYKDVLNDTLTCDEIGEVIVMLHKKAKNDKDVPAAKILLEYYLGKPDQTVNQNNTHTINDFKIKDILKFDSPKP